MGKALVSLGTILALLGFLAHAGNRPHEEGWEGFRPQWRVGTRWVVETRTPALPSADWQKARPVRWEFVVGGIEPLAGRDCFRVEVRCLETEDRQPRVVFWVERHSGALRAVEGRLEVAGVPRRLWVSYEFPGEQATPVIGPFPALPVDLPVFWTDRTKHLDSFRYAMVAGPPGQKALGEVGFWVEVQQETQGMEQGALEQWKAKGLVKSVDKQQVAQVRLRGWGGEVHQVWQKGQVWPVFVDNGITRARLLEVER